MDSAHLGKMTKRITAKKLSLRKVRIRSLEGRKIGGQPSKDTLEWKVNKKLLGKQHQKKKKEKEKNYEKQGKNKSSEWLAQHGLLYPGEQRRRISGTLKPQNDAIKGRSSQH